MHNRAVSHQEIICLHMTYQLWELRVGMTKLLLTYQYGDALAVHNVIIHLVIGETSHFGCTGVADRMVLTTVLIHRVND